MSDATQTQTLEQTLNKTDLGHVLYENRKIFFGVVIAVLLGATGYTIWKQSQKASALETSVKVFEFQSGIWAEAKAGKKGLPEAVKAFEALDEKVRTAPVMVPVALDMGKHLYDKGNYAEAETVLSKIKTDNAVSNFFVGMQRAVVLETLGKTDEAIAALEPVATAKDKYLPGMTSLHLGRLHLKKGDKDKARQHFDYVATTFPNDEQGKLAKLYLQQIGK